MDPRGGTTSASAPEDEFVRIATVGRAHGLRGHFVIDIDSTMAEVVVPGLVVRLQKIVGRHWATKITTARTTGTHMVWAVEGLDDRTAAEAWVGAAVLVAKERLPTVDEGEYFDFELIDAEVVDTEGQPLGRVREIVATGANDVLVAQGPRGEVLIPATRHAVIEVDRVERRIVVNALALVYADDRDRS